MDDLDKRIKRVYLSKTLSEEQLEKIINQSQQKTKKSFSVSKKIIKYAAIALILTSTVYGLYFLPLQKENRILNEFATEIVFNHQKTLPVEFETNNIQHLSKKLNKLNFKISLPSRITDSLELKGGRYCSVDNRIAAQLKLKNEQGKLLTCYIFKKEEHFSFDKKISKENVWVQIWSSDGLIYALASEK